VRGVSIFPESIPEIWKLFYLQRYIRMVIYLKFFHNYGFLIKAIPWLFHFFVGTVFALQIGERQQ